MTALPEVTFTGPAIDDPELLPRLPAPLAALLAEFNGLVAFGGGLHLRGACTAPEWHSLRLAWERTHHDWTTLTLRSFRAGGGVLRPGQLLSVYPPFATAEAAGGVSLRPVDAGDRLAFLAGFAKLVRGEVTTPPPEPGAGA